MRIPAPAVIVPATIGCLLRLYEVVALENVPLSDRNVLALFWPCLPYFIAVGLAFLPRLQVGAAGFASACLLADLYAHHALFRGPGTDSLFIAFLPLWNLLVIGPSGALAAWLLARWRGSRAP